MPVKEGVMVEGSAVVEVPAEVGGGGEVVDVRVRVGDGDRLAIGSASDSWTNPTRNKNI